MLAIMVRDVCDHLFSSLDSRWLLRTGLILPRATGQYELMTQRNGLDTNALGQWFELASGTSRSLLFRSDMLNRICPKSATPW